MTKRAPEKAAGYALAATALISCPCHLVLLLPAAVGLLGGTALGAALAAHTGWVITGATVYFVGALAGGFYLLSEREGRAAVYSRTRPAHETQEREANERSRPQRPVRRR